MSETPLKDNSIGRPGSPAASEEPSFGGDGGGNIDFDVDTSGQQFNVDVGLSLDTTSTSPDRRRSNLGDLELSGLADEEEDDGEASAKKLKPTAGRKRMKKRRKIVIDNNQTELSSEHMKAMLRDTSDTVLQNVPHLASWPRDDIEEDDVYAGICPALQKLPTERLLARPCIGDDGGLAPELLALWGRNMCKITGKVGTRLPFRMRGKGQRDAALDKPVAIEGEEEDDEDVERVRSQQTRDSIDGHKLNAEDDGIEFGGRDEDIDFGNDDKQEEYNADMETPFDIHDEFGTAEYKADDLAEDDERSVRSDRSSFSLGAVNDLEKELYDISEENNVGEEGGMSRQMAGDELVSHQSKWHKHTVRVLGMLKRNFQSNNGDEMDDEEEVTHELSYNRLTAGCSRRTAAGVFFEMLQLKTWDFIELDQNKSYGDIVITPGLRFEENHPSAIGA